MNEKPPAVYESNNKLELSEDEVRTIAVVHEFRVDPHEILQEIKANILDEFPEAADIVLIAVNEIEHIYDAAQSEPEIANEIVDTDAKAFLAAEKHSLDYYRRLFKLLADADYSYAEVFSWVTMQSDAATPEDILGDRGLRVVFNEIYK